MKRFLVADDHPLFREALKGSISGKLDAVEFLESGSVEEMMRQLDEVSSVDLILLDLTMPGGELFNGLISLREDHPNIPVVIVSATESLDVVAQVMALGAHGFIPKSSSSDQIASAIISVLNGETWLPPQWESEINAADTDFSDVLQRFRELTPKQLVVLKYLRTGMMNKQIAYELHVTEATVKAHISAILKKLEINTRTQAVLQMDKLNLTSI